MFDLPFTVERSIEIEKDVATVYAKLADFKTWRDWSPWLSQEPDCAVHVSANPGQPGHGQEWNGEFIGSGNMRLIGAKENETLEYDLFFLKPWKSHSQTGFRLETSGQNTRVTWWMKGTVPIFLFFMRKMMSVYVGGDYERGLEMLKAYLEDGRVPSLTQVGDVSAREGFYYVGFRHTCSVAEVGPAMGHDFEHLGELVKDGKIPPGKFGFSIYHKFDMVRDVVEYTSGFGGPTEPDVPGVTDQPGLVTGHLPAHRALQVSHTGSYRFLGNAWSAAMGCARSLHKVNKKLDMYEVYINNPGEVDDKDLKVEIYLPVK